MAINLKIEPDSLAGSKPLEASRTNESAKTAHSAQLGTQAAASGDTVTLSGLSARIAETVSAGEVHAGRRVSELAAQYARGQYHVEAKTLGRAIVQHALSEPVKETGE